MSLFGIKWRGLKIQWTLVRAGSSPASSTKEKPAFIKLAFFIQVQHRYNKLIFRVYRFQVGLFDLKCLQLNSILTYGSGHKPNQTTNQHKYTITYIFTDY